MKYKLDMDQDVMTLIRHMHPNRRKKIKEAMRSIALDPEQGKALQEELFGYRSYRIGRLRSIYQIHSKAKIIHIIALGPRKTIYEDIEFEMSRQKQKSQ